MKLICTQENFKKAIYNCERVVSKRNTLPILNNILLETEKGGLRVSATNLEIGVVAKVSAKIEKEGKITIPAKLISNFSTNLPTGENVILETIEDRLKIKSGLNKAIINGISANDFPLIPSKKTNFLLIILNSDLRKILTKIMPAIAFNEARQELTGVNLIFKNETLFFAATDSFRLAEYKLKLNEKNKADEESYQAFIKAKENIIIPFGTLSELNRIISIEDEGQVKIAIEEGQIFFNINGTQVVSRLINGKYPEYKHIMPVDYKTRIVGDRQTLQNAVKMASLFSTGGSGEITLKIDQEAKKIFILSKSTEAGENSGELNFEATGPSQEIIFNSKYLLDGINAVSSSQIAICANSNSTPVAIKEIDEKNGQVLDNFIYIVMPIKN
jgi:DNA polymerase-3 subunit beta